MIQRLSVALAAHIKQRTPDHPASIAVMAYSLSFIINMAAIILLTTLVGIITDHLLDAITVLFSFALLRQASGGYHLKSSITCIIVSTVLLTLLALTPDMTDKLLLIVNVAALIIVAVFAPSRMHQQTRIPTKFNPALKLVSLLIVSSNLLIGSSVLAATFLTQSILLIVRGGEKP